MVVRGKGSNANMTTAWASNVYIVLHTDMILEIRDVGCQVFDSSSVRFKRLYHIMKYYVMI
jgi:hypothetical protein